MSGSSANSVLNLSIVKAETTQDFCLIESWLADEKIWKYLGPPFTGGGYKHTAMAFASRKGVSVLFLVMLEQRGAGVVGLSDICLINKRANLWFALGEMCYAGQGVMRAASAKAVDYAFDYLGLHTVSAWTIGPNKASVGILRGNHFEHFGTQAEAFCFEGGFVDVLRFNRINTSVSEQGAGTNLSRPKLEQRNSTT